MIRKILVPVDGSPLSEGALPQALAVAKAFDSEIVVLRVQETEGPKNGGLVDSVSWRLARAEAGSYVGGLAERLRGQGARATGVLAEGGAAEEILKQVREQAADLVVLSSHGRGGPDAFSLGGTSQKVLSRVDASVLVVRAAEPPGDIAAEVRYPRVMVPLDGSQRAEWALLQAMPLARAHQGELLLVHVVACPPLAGRMPPSLEESELARRIVERDRRLSETYLRAMEELMTGSGVHARSLLLESPHVVQTLQKVAADEQVSIIVVSAHGCSGAAPWPYGSVADRLIHRSAIPLLVLQDLSVREPERVSAGLRAAAAASA